MIEDEDDTDMFTIIIPVICVTIAIACLITVFVVLRYVSIALSVIYVAYFIVYSFRKFVNIHIAPLRYR